MTTKEQIEEILTRFVGQCDDGQEMTSEEATKALLSLMTKLPNTYGPNLQALCKEMEDFSDAEGTPDYYSACHLLYVAYQEGYCEGSVDAKMGAMMGSFISNEIATARLQGSISAREAFAEILKKEIPEFSVLIDRLKKEHENDEF